MLAVETLDVVVIGAGVVGLAVAREIARSGREVVVLESEKTFGTQASSRNSEVIHAGIYYPTGSLKAKTCVRGKNLLYRYCEEHNLPHKTPGKLLVAVNDNQIQTLEKYLAIAQKNGVRDLYKLDRSAINELEPELNVCAAVMSPSTGIIDAHALMLQLIADLEQAGGTLVYNSPVTGGNVCDGRLRITVGGLSDTEVRCNLLINCAGLEASNVAYSLGLGSKLVPKTRYARGHYFSLAGKSPFRHLVYPIPDNASLGVHVTIDLGGQARFGPDVQWLESVDYGFSDNLEQAFRDAIAHYYPGVNQREILPAYTGIRAKLVKPGDTAGDFVISDEQEHGVAGMINLYGIESPGLTASLALAEEVSARLGSTTH